MKMMKRMLAGGAAIAALATAAPATAQYAYPYSPYGYSQYGYGYGHNYQMTQIATQQCTAAVQNRLVTRTGLTGVVASLFGVQTATPRILSITQVTPRRSTIRVRGLATTGRMAYNPWGYGYYGSMASAYQPDLQFRCDVDYRGYVRNIDIDRR